MERFWIPALFVAVVPIAACRRAAESTTADAGAGAGTGSLEIKASCDKIRTLGVCSDFTAGDLDRRGDYALQNECTRLGGAWTTGACPNWGVLGVCATSTEQRAYYTGGGVWFNESSAKRDCSQMAGAWTAKK